MMYLSADSSINHLSYAADDISAEDCMMSLTATKEFVCNGLWCSSFPSCNTFSSLNFALFFDFIYLATRNKRLISHGKSSNNQTIHQIFSIPKPIIMHLWTRTQNALGKLVASRLRLAGSSCVVKDLAPDSGAGVNVPRRSKVRYRYTCRRAVKPGLRSIACPEKNRHTVAHTQKTSIHYIIVSHSFVWKRWYSGAQSFELYNLI